VTIEPIPICPACGRPLDRIDHYGIEHLVLRDWVYWPVDAREGLASEVDLRCGYCQCSIPTAARKYFYERWYALMQGNRE